MNDPMFEIPNVGIYVYGPPETPRLRQLAQWRELLNAYADADIDTDYEAYSSWLTYGPEMLAHYNANGRSVAGFAGPTWAKGLPFDIDRPNLDEALTDARKLVRLLLQRYPMLDGSIPIYFSGSKGFHVYLELCHEPPPAVGFHDVCRTLAEGLAAAAGVRIDTAIYDVVHILRLPNTRHPKTGMYKRRLDAETLFALDIPAILERSRQPAGDGFPSMGDRFPEIETDWKAAEAETLRRAEARAVVRRDAAEGDNRAPKYFLDFLRFGVEEGERRPTLFRCAAWMAEQGAPDRLISAVLYEPAFDLGITPADVARQIASGIAHARKQNEGGSSA